MSKWRLRPYAYLAGAQAAVSVDPAANDREFVLMSRAGAVYVNETGTRSMILPGGVYLTETS